MTPLQLIIALSAFAVGAFCGAAIMHWLSANQQKNRVIAKQLQEQQNELRNYQAQVNQHFGKTAELLGDMARSYREVHNHLARGSQDLAQSNSQSERTAIPLLEEPETPAIDVTVSPPLDYAPRSNPEEKGALTEEYGLEKDETGKALKNDQASEIH